MADVMSSAARRALMARIRGRDTLPEVTLGRVLWALGLRYRLHRRVVGSRPDFVFVGARVAVFVDGCFWHVCPDHFVMPVTNQKYWRPKLNRNKERDSENSARLRRAGWKVIRIWEHEIERRPEVCARRVMRVVKARPRSRRR